MKIDGQVANLLLGWYERHARVLPWREAPTPYRVWISEIMLQQTRVETVKPYFERFLAALPDVHALAHAPEEQLLKLWEGLGYYSRVRNLQKAALMIETEFGGVFPDTEESLRRLPGVGEYTAGAIASIAFGQVAPAVDGNVMRVVTRLCAWDADIAKPRTRQTIAEALREIYLPGRCGDLTQSLMELGATVCVPNGAPLCADCPLAELCEGRKRSLTSTLPRKAAAKARTVETWTVLVCRNEAGEIALEKRPEKGLLAQMWSLPMLPGDLSAAAVTQMLTAKGVKAAGVRALGRAKHIFTHREWRMCGYAVNCPNEGNADWRWVSAAALAEGYSLPSAYKAFAIWKKESKKDF